jgi:hypothetical protein
MKNSIYTVEDSLELLVGLKDHAALQIESSDQTILQSIGRQVFKGTALTDRQYDLVREKLLKYKDQFTALEYDLDSALDNLRMPLREIDRSKYITIVEHKDTAGPNTVYESYKSKWNWIKVRFPFSKKLIVLIEEIINTIPRHKYYHDKGSHEHFFVLDERNTFEIINRFKDKNFEIDQQLISLYEKLEDMNNKKEEYIPGIYNYKLKNLSEKAINYMVSSIGNPSVENLALYKDRQEMFGLHYFDEVMLEESLRHLSVLSKKIATRNKSNVLVQRSKYTINAVAESLLELDRFPLLVILPENDPLDNLHAIHTAFKGFVERSEISVMFRLDNNTNSDFNDYVRDQKINNPLDTNTKIVYINNTSSVPKPLVMSDWRPCSALMISSLRPHSKVGSYIDDIDLVIHYDEEPSQLLLRKLEIL